ncbi:DUF6792 domain-containing protein [Pseudomonas savastanoi]|uniref:Uncharacterized protein n=1 Tax=Pseudomonas savastanoi TaxID=29438 RepID=A0A3M6AQ01_PSESS|nr:DUF6792 domain-containing protein [Pseudomonas savastanoi]KPX02995.1 hypothetical protein ALO74_200084 [Pseudomonas syringae pv. cunninghamiae]RMV21255.1 hypothetical protein ALP15_200023 [Pseudomonas savastanoi]
MNIVEIAEYATLSKAAYTDFKFNSDGENIELIKSLTIDSSFSENEAIALSTQFEVVSQSTNGIASGFSATLFRTKTDPAKYVLSVRGTNDIGDALEDILNIGIFDGIASHQTIELFNYYQDLTAKEGDKVVRYFYDDADQLRAYTEVAKETGALYGKDFVGVGHSLGGHLATTLSRLAGDAVDAVYSFNGPGFDSSQVVGTSKAELFIDNLAAMQKQLLGYTSIADEWGAQVTDIATPTDIVNKVGNSVDEKFYSYVEAINPAAAHSITGLTESLIVQSLFALMDSTVTLSTLSDIFQSSSDRDSVLETVVAALKKLVVDHGVGSAGGIATEDHSALFKAYQDVKDVISKQEIKASLVNLASLSSQLMSSLSHENIAYRYSLVEGNAFALLNDNLYTSEIEKKLELYDAKLGSGVITEAWEKLRADYLYDIFSYFSSEVVVPNSATRYIWQDIARKGLK